MEHIIPLASSAFSFLALLIIGFIGMIYRDRERELRGMAAELKGVADTVLVMKTEMITIRRDLDEAIGKTQHIDGMRKDIAHLFDRQKKHSRRVTMVENRINTLQGIPNIKADEEDADLSSDGGGAA